MSAAGPDRLTRFSCALGNLVPGDGPDGFGPVAFVRAEQSQVELVRVSREGAVETVAVLAGTNASRLAPVPMPVGFRPPAGVSLSPDGRRLALTPGNPPAELWVYDLERGSFSNLAAGVFPVRAVWNPAGQELFYASATGART